MSCNCCRTRRPTCGPWFPTLDELAQATRKLPNPTKVSPQRLTIALPPPPMRGLEVCGCYCDTVDDVAIRTVTFELRGEVDEYGSRFCRWMYSGGVRV